jgi:hypothetical protein
LVHPGRLEFFKTSNKTRNQEGQKYQNQEPESGTLFLVGSWFLPGSFGFGLPLLPSNMENLKETENLWTPPSPIWKISGFDRVFLKEGIFKRHRSIDLAASEYDVFLRK